jgi:hypothetical protein
MNIIGNGWRDYMYNRAKRCTDAEMVKRISIVYDLLVEGATRSDIFQFITKNMGIGVSVRTIDNYIHKAIKMIRKDAELDRKLELGKAKRRLNKLYYNSVKIQDYGTCLNIQKESNKLYGLYPEKKISVEPGDGDLRIVIGSPEEDTD